MRPTFVDMNPYAQHLKSHYKTQQEVNLSHLVPIHLILQSLPILQKTKLDHVPCPEHLPFKAA